MRPRRWCCTSSAGVLIGFGLAGCSFTLVIGAFGKLLPPRAGAPSAFGAGTAAGSFGQFLFSPLAVALIDQFGWQQHAADLRRHRAADPAAVARARRAARGCAGGGSAAAAIGDAGARRGVRPPQLRAAGARLSSPAAFSSSSSPCTCRPIWSIAGCRPRSAAGRSAMIGLFNIVGSIARRLARQRDAEALPAGGDLFRPLDCDPGLHPAAADARPRR